MKCLNCKSNKLEVMLINRNGDLRRETITYVCTSCHKMIRGSEHGY